MALKSLVFLALVAFALGAVFEPAFKPTDELIKLQPPFEVEWIDPSQPILIRKARSPDGGSANVDIHHDDKSGTTGTVSGSQNIWSSPDGGVQVDVNGGVSQNFDHGDTSAKVGLGIKW